ncbi:MAG: M23 family metallopeptidase [Gammaproteobacteria bacterium]|nr:M23 family metallopeptidase [Gammaproteobacteria bacterium]
MNVLFISKRFGHSACLCLTKGKLLVAAAVLLLVVPLVSLYAGYQLAGGAAPLGAEEAALVINQELDKQQQAINEARRVAEENLNALTLRLGQMQAHVFRLDALGQRLTRMAELDSGEFDFSIPPAQGGPEGEGSGDSVKLPEFMLQLDELARQLENREQQLNVLENLLMSRNLHDEVFPAGRPITKGWLSSNYGTRNDPFSGKPEFHKGVDLAGKEGSDIISVAAGVVTWAGKRYGYGNLVEVNHGNGYVTRYGHAKEVLVTAGETIRKGQRIASMGSTGRSTGPHVHFEVWVDGHTVDPSKYIHAAK